MAVAGVRAAVAVGIGVVSNVVAAAFFPWQVAVLIGWDVAALGIVIWVFAEVWDKDSEQTAALATREDDSRTAADLILVSASLASLVGVALALVKASQQHGTERTLTTAIAVLTVMLSWCAVNAMFTLRYGHIFYSEGGGVNFHGDDKPDYRDFAYLAFTIGMTYQVSDTDLTTRSFRRTATRHALLSYVFGTFVVAMTINVVAGLLN